MFKEFKQFIARGNVVDLAVGIIMGAAFTGVVNSIVADLVMPVIGYVMKGIDFSSLMISLNGEHYTSVKAAKDAGAPVITYGQFINVVINFMIVSTVIFFLVRAVNKLKRQSDKDSAHDEPPADVKLLTEIRDLLKNR